MTVADQSNGSQDGHMLTDQLEKIKLDGGDEHLLHVESRRNMLSHF